MQYEIQMKPINRQRGSISFLCPRRRSLITVCDRSVYKDLRLKLPCEIQDWTARVKHFNH